MFGQMRRMLSTSLAMGLVVALAVGCEPEAGDAEDGGDAVDGGEDVSQPSDTAPEIDESVVTDEPGELHNALVSGLPEASCFSLPTAGYRVGDTCLGWLARNSAYQNKRHSADDMCAASGTSVNAAGAGKVVYARAHGTCPNWGHLVAIEHRLRDGSSAVSLYGHTIPSVAEGSTVAQGQTIGRIGRYSCWADHVHFAVAQRDWGAAIGTYAGWVHGYFPTDQTPTAPYTDPVTFVNSRANCPPIVGPHTYTRSGTTRTVTVRFRDPESQAPTMRRLSFRYNDAAGQLRTGSADMTLSIGAAGDGTYRYSASIAGTQFKFYTEWRDAGGISVRYPTSGWVE